VIEIETEALNQFKRMAHLHLSSPVIAGAKSVVAWWTLMQHYRAPTRLLDWTTSPFVACYFAVEADVLCDGAIWIVNADRLQEAVEKRFGEEAARLEHRKPEELWKLFRNPQAEPNRLHAIIGETQTDRMVAQQTVLTVSEYVCEDHERALEDLLGEGTSLQKLIIPYAVKWRYLFQLQKMNITARALFPGADGLGQSVSELVQLAAYYYGPLKNVLKYTAEE
jgi:FRG domain